MRKKCTLIVFVMFALIEMFCRYGFSYEYLLSDAYIEFTKIDDDMTIFKTVGHDTNRIFAIDAFGTVRAFNITEYSEVNGFDNVTFDIDNMEIYQCRKWHLSPIEYFLLKYKLSKIKVDDKELMQYYYGGYGSYYLRKNGNEYYVGYLEEVFNISEDAKKYAIAWSNLIDALNKYELQRYRTPMNNDDAWYASRTIDHKLGIFKEKEYFEKRAE